MKICYYDESGDDGYPRYSSPIFFLCCLYVDHLNWKMVYESLAELRRRLKTENNFPVRLEMHTKQFLLNKFPYKRFNFSNENRIQIIDEYCKHVSELEIKVLNVVINKTKIIKDDYKVLNTALRYSVQRVENDINPETNPNERFLIITDSGRVGKMRKITRAMQRINYIPSQYPEQSYYRREISALIEDPLPKDSRESYLIQIADLIAYLSYLFVLKREKIGDFPNRLDYLSLEKLTEWMQRLKKRFNLKASKDDPEYGFVIYPK